MDRVISVEYAARDDDERRNGYSPERRGCDRSPDRNYSRERSPSPYRRDRGSPDYGHGQNTNSRPQRGNHAYEKAEGPENERYRRFILSSTSNSQLFLLCAHFLIFQCCTMM